MAQIPNPTELKIRQLQCKIILQSGVFLQGYNTKIINDNTINAVINKTLSNNFTNSADITIYGMNESDIAALTTLGYSPLSYEANQIELYAKYQDGDSKNISLCFKGFIVKAWANFADPSRPMHFQCQTTYQNALKNAPAINIKGTANILDIFKNLSSSIGCSLKNNGVDGIINNPILSGSSIDQLKILSKQTNSNCVVDDNIVKIAPKGNSLSTEILNINSESGLLSYPMIDVWGVKFKMRYNPQLQLGQYVALQTSTPLPKSIGKWYVYDMQSSLNNRHENWYTDVKCSYNNVDFS